MNDARRSKTVWIVGALGIAVIILVIVIVFLWRRTPTGPTVAIGAADAAIKPQPTAPDTGTGRPAVSDRGVRPPRQPKPGTRRLTDHELRDVQRRNRALIRACVERQRLGADGPSKANVVLELGQGGKISKVAVDTGGDLELAECLRRMIRSWHFPSDLRAQQVAFPMVLSGSER